MSENLINQTLEKQRRVDEKERREYANRTLFNYKNKAEKALRNKNDLERLRIIIDIENKWKNDEYFRSVDYKNYQALLWTFLADKTIEVKLSAMRAIENTCLSSYHDKEQEKIIENLLKDESDAVRREAQRIFLFSDDNAHKKAQIHWSSYQDHEPIILSFSLFIPRILYKTFVLLVFYANIVLKNIIYIFKQTLIISCSILILIITAIVKTIIGIPLALFLLIFSFGILLPLKFFVLIITFGNKELFRDGTFKYSNEIIEWVTDSWNFLTY